MFAKNQSRFDSKRNAINFTFSTARKFNLLTLSLLLALSPLSAFAAGSDSSAGKPNGESAIAKKTDSANSTEKKEEKKDKETVPAKIDVVDTSVMTRMVEALEERVRQLEEKLASYAAKSTEPTAESKTFAVTVPALAAVPTTGSTVAAVPNATVPNPPAQDTKDADNKTLGFFRDVEISGLVDGYYSYNNNKVDMFTQGRAFDVRHNAFSLQLAKLTVEKKNSKESPLGFRVDLGFGETVDRVISISDSSRNDATKHVLQAYASYYTPVGLTLDFGKFYTPVGAEVVETKDNFNYSRGWLFTYGPYYHAGLRAKYAVNDKVAVTGFLVNGWDNLFENNVKTGKTGGFQLGLTPNKKFALTQTYLVGNEAPLANVPNVSKRDNVRHVADTVATVYATDKFTLLGNMVFGSDGDNNGVRGSWQGFAGYFKYAFTNNLAFSPRFEVLRDRDGIRTGVGQTVKDLTLTQELKLKDNFITRFEYRRDFSDQKFFTNSRNVARDNQNTFIIGVSYFFSTKQ